eukprot:gene25022-15657_t
MPSASHSDAIAAAAATEARLHLLLQERDEELTRRAAELDASAAAAARLTIDLGVARAEAAEEREGREEGRRALQQQAEQEEEAQAALQRRVQELLAAAQRQEQGAQAEAERLVQGAVEQRDARIAALTDIGRSIGMEQNALAEAEAARVESQRRAAEESAGELRARIGECSSWKSEHATVLDAADATRIALSERFSDDIRSTKDELSQRTVERDAAAADVTRLSAQLAARDGAHMAAIRRRRVGGRRRGKGITACDESVGTIGGRFEKVGIENTEENRRTYRQMLFETPGATEFLSGAILDPETIHQKSSNSGKTFPAVLTGLGIVPGVKPHLKAYNLPGQQGSTIMRAGHGGA